MPARDRLEPRDRGYPEFGALHRITATSEVFGFFAEVTKTADEIFMDSHKPQASSIDGIDLGSMVTIVGLDQPDDQNVNEDAEDPEGTEENSWYRQDDFYRVYDHSTVWVGIIEANAARKKAQSARSALQASDLGLMKQEACDASAKINPELVMKLCFDDVLPVGQKQSNGNARGMQTRLALLPNVELYHETRAKLTTEFDVISSFIRRQYKQSFLQDRFVPWAEFLTFRHGATHQDINEVVAGIKEELRKKPLHITLQPLEFPEPRITKRKRR